MSVTRSATPSNSGTTSSSSAPTWRRSLVGDASSARSLAASFCSSSLSRRNSMTASSVSWPRLRSSTALACASSISQRAHSRSRATARVLDVRTMAMVSSMSMSTAR